MIDHNPPLQAPNTKPSRPSTTQIAISQTLGDHYGRDVPFDERALQMGHFPVNICKDRREQIATV